MSITSLEDPLPSYRDPSRSIDERVADLLGQMTPAEKLAQLGSAWVFQLSEGDQLSPAKASTLLEHGIGHVTRISGASTFTATQAAAIANQIQRHLLEQTRLGIPAIVHEEVGCGLMARDATVFPQAIGVASTWEPALAERMADAIRAEMRALGVHQGLAPVLDITRDPRWGRTEETFGEDPHLVATMGMAFVRGLQGGGPEGVIATGKHLVGYGASEGGLNWAPPHIPDRELRDVYLHPFEAAVRAAGLRSVMNAYHDLDGIPCGADQDLLTGLLRDGWGFQGCVVSDYFAVRQLVDYHHFAGDGTAAAAMALEAGLDVELPSTDCFGEPLAAAIRDGAIDIRLVDRAVSRVLRSKFEMGLFEHPYVDSGRAGLTVGAAGHVELAGQVARKSLVLLRNDGILPLTPGSRVAVIGPNAGAGRHLLGDYTYTTHIESLIEMRNRENVFSIPLPEGLELVNDAPQPTAVFEALRARLGPGARFEQGCGVSDPSTAGFDAAVRLAEASDVAVMVMGDKSGLTADCTSGESRDRSSLDLPGAQEDLIRAVVATGTPVVLVLVSGRPSGSVWAHESCSAVMIAWLPGQTGAEAIADALIGAVNPGGKLPISFPRSAGHIPVYYGHKVSGGRSHWKGDYADAPAQPLYPFGHGLSYTSFAVSSMVVSPDRVTASGEVTVRATLANLGDRVGDEVVQVYVRDPIASVTRPVIELKSFARLALGPGESGSVEFTLPVSQLGFHGRDLEYVVEPGEIEVLVGTSSEAIERAGVFTVIPDHEDRPVERAYEGSVSWTEGLS